MNKRLNIHGYGDNLTINDIRIGDLSPLEHEKIEIDKGGKNFLTALEMYDSPKLDGHHISVKLLKKGVYAKETHKNTVRIAQAHTIETWQIDNIAESIRNVINEI
jgi:acetylornithine/succinyldiaminopimelate/putrescine aminotransferase